ncbi:MAG: NADP-dependent oxidoreductase, partial [Marinibacterium sp.]
MSDTLRRIVLASRPEGAPVADNFRLEEAPLPDPAKGEVLVAVDYLSLDPYMRGRMNAGPSYAAPVGVGDTMEGEGVGTVIASNSPRFSRGDVVRGPVGWASHAVLPADQCIPVDPAQGPVTTSLGVLGMPGITAWHGLTA